MRLSSTEKDAILEVARSHDPSCEVLLYGSRTNMSQRGGDIDLLILSETISFSQKISILVEIKKRIGEQKIDLIIKTREEAASDPFIVSIQSSAIPLK